MQNSPAVKKSVVSKMVAVKIQGGGQEMADMVAKILMTTVQENSVSNPSETWRRQQLLLLKFLPLAYDYSHLLAAMLDFRYFSQQPS